MLLAGKIAASLLLPPGLILLLLLGTGTVFLFRRKFGTGAVFLSFAALVWVCSVPWVAQAAVRSLENEIRGKADPRGCDVIVVLGSGIVQGSPEQDGAPLPSLESLKRLDAALRWHRKTGLPVLVSGGVVFKEESTVPEGEVMARHLIQNGVPPDRIAVESKSRNTEENAVCSVRLMRSRGWNRPFVVTSAWHQPRAVRCFRRAGVEPAPCPVAFRTDRPVRLTARDFLPAAWAAGDLQLALRERMGSAWLDRVRPDPPL